MGLPQVTYSEPSEVTVSLSTLVQNRPAFADMSTCGLETECVRSSSGNAVCSSIGELNEQISPENNLLIPMSVRSPLPFSRILGFSMRSSSTSNAQNLDDSAPSSTYDITVGESESNGSLARKRMLSPLSSRTFPKQFSGASLDIGGSNFQSDSQKNSSSYICV